jgi:hypothetical protein
MTDRKTLAARALIEAQILKDLRAAHEKTRAELAATFIDTGEREVATLLDLRLGTVSLEGGKAFWTVVDEAAFFEWATTWSLGATEQRVRPAFQSAVLAKCKSDGAFYVDEETGEAFIPPGVERRTSAPSLVERPTKDAGLAVREWLGAETAKQLGIEA